MTDTLSDRERILTTLVDRLSTTMLLRTHGRMHDADSFSDGYGGHYVHFAYYRKPIKGDLVIGKTSRIDQWKIGFYEEEKDRSVGLHVILDINTGQPCDYGNEEFVPIVGMDPTALLVRDERAVFEKVLGAFREGDEYMYRYGGFRFDDAGRAVVRVRESHGGFGKESVPFEIAIDWTPETTVDQILTAMRAGGYGTKSFRPETPAA